MNVKTLIALTALTVLAVVAAFWLSAEQQTAPEPQAQALVPGLEEAVNEVTALKVIGAGDATVAVLERGDQGWTVADKAGYPADLGKVRETLLALAQAQIVEQKTAKSDYYERLGVRDVNDSDATGIRIEIEGLKKTVALIVGKNADGIDGSYVRRVGEAQSYLVSGSLAIERDAARWLDREILDLPASRIQSLTLRHPDGGTVTVTNENQEQPAFTLTNLPEGRELSFETAADALAGALEGLTLQDVVPAASLDAGAHQPVEGEYRTFDGLVVRTRAFRVEDKNYVQFNVSFNEEGARTEAERLNARLGPWIYVLADYSYENVTQRLEDLLKPVESNAR